MPDAHSIEAKPKDSSETTETTDQYGREVPFPEERGHKCTIECGADEQDEDGKSDKCNGRPNEIAYKL